MFDQLQLADLAAEIPQLPTETLTPTLPVRSEWLRPDWFYFVSDTLSINGATKTWDDTDGSDFTNSYRAGDFNPGTQVNRAYHGLTINLGGTGTTTPIKINLYFAIGGSWLGLLGVNANNTGGSRFTFPSFVVPAGLVVVINTVTNGGSGDNMQVSGWGTSSPAGVPLVEGGMPLNAGP
jgi:hypothetical protein